jgi:hypothetical protein
MLHEITPAGAEPVKSSTPFTHSKQSSKDYTPRDGSVDVGPMEKDLAGAGPGLGSKFKADAFAYHPDQGETAEDYVDFRTMGWFQAGLVSTAEVSVLTMSPNMVPAMTKLVQRCVQPYRGHLSQGRLSDHKAVSSRLGLAL